MKKLFFILCLLSTLSYGQQTIELCEENQKTFTYTSDAGVEGTYVWSVNDISYVSNSLTYTWEKAGEFLIKLLFTSNEGCKDSVSYNISVIECRESFLWFPNAFTPNGSDLNDTWSPKGYNYSDLEYFVYNRWGELLFTSTSEYNPWNGKYKGVDCKEDVYVFMATWKTSDKRPKKQYGRITLLR